MLKRILLPIFSIAALLFGLSIATTAMAQSATGEIRGVVTDPTGAVIASANVVLASSEGATSTTSTGHDGSSTSPPLRREPTRS